MRFWFRNVLPMVLVWLTVGWVCIGGEQPVDPEKTVRNLAARLKTPGLTSETLEEVTRGLADFLQLSDTDTIVFQDAFQALQSVDEDRLPPDVRLALGMAWARQGNTDRAAESILSLILKHPEPPDVYRYQLALARVFRDGGRFEKAEAQLEPLLTRPGTIRYWAALEKARLLAAEKKYPAAMKSYDRLIRLCPEPVIAELAADERSRLPVPVDTAGQASETTP